MKTPNRRTLIVTAIAALAVLTYGYAEARGGGKGGGKSGGRSGASRSGGWHGHAHSHVRSYGGGFHRPGGIRSGGFFVAAPIFGSAYGLYPYYSGYAAPAAPVYYIERTDGHWYYCKETARYYPDVETRESPWIPVEAYTASAAGAAP